MSFILEALKKSDKKRLDGEIPKLETVHKVTLSGTAERSKWLWLLLFVLCVNTAVLLWLFGPWSQQESAPQVVKVTPAVPIETSAVAGKPQQGETLVLVPVQEPIQETVPSEVPVVPLPSTEHVQQSPPPLATAVALPAETAFEALPEKIYLPTDLPPAVRQSLPALHMSLHAFNPESAAASLVRINDQLMRVGSRLANRYLLEEITVDGAILRYDAYRILVPRKQAQGD